MTTPKESHTVGSSQDLDRLLLARLFEDGIETALSADAPAPKGEDEQTEALLDAL